MTVYGVFTLTANFTRGAMLSITATMPSKWVYQNTPGTTLDRHVLALTVSVTQDLWGNSAYITTVTQSGPGVVTPTASWTSGTTVTPAASAWWAGLSGYLVGGRVSGTVTSPGNLALTGSCTVHVVVTGNVGGSASTDVTITVRPLGDITGDLLVNGTDRSYLQGKLNGLSPPADPLAFDLDGDGSVTTADQVLLYRVLNGLPVP